MPSDIVLSEVQVSAIMLTLGEIKTLQATQAVTQVDFQKQLNTTQALSEKTYAAIVGNGGVQGINSRLLMLETGMVGLQTAFAKEQHDVEVGRMASAAERKLICDALDTTQHQINSWRDKVIGFAIALTLINGALSILGDKIAALLN